MTRGKVVLVPFPFDDLSTAKVRPAVCLTDPIGVHRHVIVAFISSRVPTDLQVASTVRLHRLMTITTALIRRELGKLSPRMRHEVAARLQKLFALV